MGHFENLLAQMQKEQNQENYHSDLTTNLEHLRTLNHQEQQSYFTSLNMKQLQHRKAFYNPMVERQAENQNLFAYQNKNTMKEHMSLNRNFLQLNDSLYKGRDSTSMKKVKLCMLDMCEAFSLPLVKEGDIFSPRRKVQIEKMMSEKYQNLIDACKDYEASHKGWKFGDGRDRRNYVIAIRTICEKEKTRFRHALERLSDELMEDTESIKQHYTLEDVLRESRTVQTPLTALHGGNNSSVFLGNLKEEEKVIKVAKEEKFLDLIQNFSQTIPKDNKDYQADVWKTFDTELKKLLKNLENIDLAKSSVLLEKYEAAVKDTMTEEEKKNLKEKCLKNFKTNFQKTIKRFLTLSLSYGLSKDPFQRRQRNFPKESVKNDFTDIAKNFGIQENHIFYTSFLQFIEHGIPIGKNFNHMLELTDQMASVYKVKHYNTIEPDAPLAYRNVATTRMNMILGFGKNLVTKSVMYQFTKGPYSGKGAIVQDKAQGKGLYSMIKKWKENDIKPEITPEAMQQILRLQLLDQICGQGDRHGDNVFIQLDPQNENRIIGVTGIDNDMSFGSMNAKTITKGYNRLPALRDVNGVCSYKYIDQKTYDAIQNLDMEMIRFLLADCKLSKKEFSAMEERLNAVKSSLEDAYQKKTLHFLDHFAEMKEKVTKEKRKKKLLKEQEEAEKAKNLSKEQKEAEKVDEEDAFLHPENKFKKMEEDPSEVNAADFVTIQLNEGRDTFLSTFLETGLKVVE